MYNRDLSFSQVTLLHRDDKQCMLQLEFFNLEKCMQYYLGSYMIILTQKHLLLEFRHPVSWLTISFFTLEIIAKIR